MHAKEILAKYHDTAYETLPKISHQKFNDYIKECCRLAGINQPTTIVRFSGGERTELVFPKWKLITSHTARKTFVTNSLILGMKEMVIRNITGHKKEETSEGMLKLQTELNGKKLSAHGIKLGSDSEPNFIRSIPVKEKYLKHIKHLKLLMVEQLLGPPDQLLKILKEHYDIQRAARSIR